MQGIGEMGSGKLQLHIDQLFQFRRRMKVQVLRTVEQAHTGEQADQPEIMVAVQVGDEDVIDLAAFYFVPGKLYLGPFAAVN